MKHRVDKIGQKTWQGFWLANDNETVLVQTERHRMKFPVLQELARLRNTARLAERN